MNHTPYIEMAADLAKESEKISNSWKEGYLTDREYIAEISAIQDLVKKYQIEDLYVLATRALLIHKRTG